MRPKGTGRMKRRKKSVQKEKEREKRPKGGSLTGGHKYAPKGNGKDEKEKKSVQKEKEGEKRREKAERRITNGWAQICAQREREG